MAGVLRAVGTAGVTGVAGVLTFGSFVTGLTAGAAYEGPLVDNDAKYDLGSFVGSTCAAVSVTSAALSGSSFMAGRTLKDVGRRMMPQLCSAFVIGFTEQLWVKRQFVHREV